jgi:alkylation response protein AidB-like acyl-CoA dehydrogenase
MLSSERSSIGGGTSARAAKALIATATSLGRHGDPVVRQQLAKAHTRETIIDLLPRRARDGAAIPMVGSVVKLLYSEHARLTADDALALLGPAALVEPLDDGSVARSWIDRFLFAPGLRLGGGTDEIQRNQIAERGLGLPRDPAPPGGQAR